MKLREILNAAFLLGCLAGSIALTGCTAQTEASYCYRLYGAVSSLNTQDGVPSAVIEIVNLTPVWEMEETYCHEMFDITDYDDISSTILWETVSLETDYTETLPYDESDEELVFVLRAFEEDGTVLQITVEDGKICAAEKAECYTVLQMDYENNVVLEMMPWVSYETLLLRTEGTEENYNYECYTDWVFLYCSWAAEEGYYSSANLSFGFSGNPFVYYIRLNDGEDYGQILVTSDMYENYLVSGNARTDAIFGALSYSGDKILRADIQAAWEDPMPLYMGLDSTGIFLKSSLYLSEEKFTYEAIGEFDYYRLFAYERNETGLVETKPAYLYLDEFCASEEASGRVFRLRDGTVIHLLGIDASVNRLDYLTEDGTAGSVEIPSDESGEKLFAD